MHVTDGVEQFPHDLFQFCQNLPALDRDRVLMLSRKIVRNQLQDTPEEISREFGLLSLDLLEYASEVERKKVEHKALRVDAKVLSEDETYYYVELLDRKNL